MWKDRSWRRGSERGIQWAEKFRWGAEGSEGLFLVREDGLPDAFDADSGDGGEDVDIFGDHADSYGQQSDGFRWNYQYFQGVEG